MGRPAGVFVWPVMVTEGEVIGRYMRWRNARVQPKTRFAPNSVIRTWTGYQTSAA